MAGRIPQNFIDDLISRLDIVDVVSARTRLKKAGKNYSACCPFHNEKTPSFTVSPDKQFYYCFGCGATGSAVKFVMEFDGLEFPDAVEKLAGDLNLEVPREGNQQQSQEPQYRELFKLTQKSADFF
jgi:DNA primase